MDLINGLDNYTISIQCISQEAEVLALTKEEFSAVRKAQGDDFSELSAFFNSRIDNYCGIIYNKNLVSSEMDESENPQ